MASDMSRPMESLETSVEVDAPLRATYDQWTQFEESSAGGEPHDSGPTSSCPPAIDCTTNDPSAART